MNLPVYKLIINDEDETGVEYVALVDDPAIKRNWVAFNIQHQFKVENEEKRIVSGPLMIADMPIYRRSENMGEYYVVFDADTIMQIVQKYFKNQRNNNVNKMHLSSEKVEGVYCFESFIIDSKRGIMTPKGFDTLPDGSWFGSFKVDNESVWAEIKAGEFKGFSVEGVFDMVPAMTEEEKMIKKIIDILNGTEI
jgi:hypothetical protein